MVQLSHPYNTTGKTIALTRWTFVGKTMLLLSNILSRFVTAFLPRSKCLLISWLWLQCAMILEPKEIKSVTASIFSPSICYDVKGLAAIILVFFSCWVSSQLFHSPLSSRDSFLVLYFPLLEWYHLPIWDCWYFSWQSWFQLGFHPAWHFTWCTLHIS